MILGLTVNGAIFVPVAVERESVVTLLDWSPL